MQRFPEIELARWVLSEQPGITHLKLQKLCFYAYGYGLAEGHADELGDVRFEAWTHGPVCREVYDRYQAHGRAPIPVDAPPPAYSQRAETTLRHVLSVYGQLSAWELREQSHLEPPWCNTRINAEIPRDAIRQHFAGRVTAPAWLFGMASGALDGIPEGRPLQFDSIGAMAAALGR